MTEVSEREREAQPRLRAWERRVEIPMLVLAGVFLATYAWPVVDDDLAPGTASLLGWLSIATWAAFVVDYAVRLVLAERRWDYAKRHWWEVPIVVLPMLRPLRLLQLLVLVRVFNRSAVSVASRVATYVAGTTVLAIGLGALVVLDAEQEVAEANIQSYPDALWWACATVSTAGYGDYYPVTGTGRFAAVVLMVVGVALVGALTATVAAWLVDKVEVGRDEEGEERLEARTVTHQETLLAELRGLREEIAELRGERS